MNAVMEAVSGNDTNDGTWLSSTMRTRQTPSARSFPETASIGTLTIRS